MCIRDRLKAILRPSPTRSRHGRPHSFEAGGLLSGAYGVPGPAKTHLHRKYPYATKHRKHTGRGITKFVD
eukprot:5832902-Alexandrium_andersonii.AAC.1